MAEHKRKSQRVNVAHESTAITPPHIYNHHQMLREIRDNLKHLRREPESQVIESGNKDNETTQPRGYTVSATTTNLNTHRTNQPRVQTQRANHIEARRVIDQIPSGNRVYDESGYSSSSSECSSLSANEFNSGQQQQSIGNIPFHEESLHQGLYSPQPLSSNFNFVRAMANNDGYKRINPNVSQPRRDVASPMSPMSFHAKSPPPYRVATQQQKLGSSEQLPTNHTSKVETKYMQKTALPSGGTTISQAEWKVTTGPEVIRGRSPVPFSRTGIPEGGARWKTRPYSVSQKPLPAPPNQGAYNMSPYHPQQAQQQQQHQQQQQQAPPQQTPTPQSQQVSPQFQVQVSLNAGNLPAAPVMSKAPAPSATFRVSVQTSPVNAANYSNMPQPYQRPEPSVEFHEQARYEQAYHQAVSHYVQPASNPRSNLAQPPPYNYASPPSGNSSFTSYHSNDSDLRPNQPGAEQSYEIWGHRSAPSFENMSISSGGSESNSSTIEEEAFPEFDHASLTSQDELDDGESPVCVTNKTGTLIVYVKNRPMLDTNERDHAEGAAAGDSKTKDHKRTRPEAYKFFMEQRMENVIKERQEREQRRVQLEEEMRKVQLSEEAQSEMRKILNQKESNYIRLKRTKMDPSMFQTLQVIGVGAFGEVCLTRHLQSGSLYAMKILKKAAVLKRNQEAHVKAERDILAEADNEWVVKLFYSFQDKQNLYFVMEYVPGGDLMSLLMKKGVFSEDMARFYIAELVLAIESVHKMGFIHRDIKPDNVLIDSDGHIKLTDFGLCTGFRWTHDSKYYQNGTLPRSHSPAPSIDMDDGTWAKERNCRCGHQMDGKKPLSRRHIRQHMRCQAHSLVGTPNYIAPEVLLRIPYTHLCDWWSVGVILYEMMVGQPPFYAPTPAETQMKVINWETTLQIPRQAQLSQNAEDLILRLCNTANRRLGINGVDDIKNHPFFQGIDWLMIRRTEAFYVPDIRHAEDTSNFDPVESDRQQNDEQSMTDMTDTSSKRKHPSHAFYEFTFRRFFTENPGRSSVANQNSWDGSDSEKNKAPVYV